MVEAGGVTVAMRRLLAAGGSRALGILSEVDGAVLHHLEEGSGSSVIVLLHGGTGGGANWFRLLPRLAAAHRVLAPDLPGFGLSAPRPLRLPLGVEAARLLRAWLDHADVESAVVVGTSFGGLAALRLAQAAPDRVRGLLLLDSAGLGRGIHPLVRLAVLPPLIRAAVRPTHRGTATVLRTLLTADRSELNDVQLDALIDYLHASAVTAGVPYLAATLRAFASPRGQREVVTPTELAALSQPVSLVWGERDGFLPVADAHRAAALCRDAHFTVIAGAGHSPNWERAGAVADAIEALVARVAGPC
jgi:pyruvate dehydrogenase E2 component (dihydrolipoamide acetyltransferase)